MEYGIGNGWRLSGKGNGEQETEETHSSIQRSAHTYRAAHVSSAPQDTGTEDEH